MSESNVNSPGRPRAFALAAGLLILAFCVPLWRLARFAFGSDLYSYILIVPLISAGMLWFRRPAPPEASLPHRGLAAVLLAAGFAVVAAYGMSVLAGMGWRLQDSLFATTLAFVLLFAGICAAILGRRTLRGIAYPLAFLVLMAPLPLALSNSLETFFQHTSAAAAYGFFELSGMPVLQHGDLGFQLPGMNLEVAPQCSGLHSSLALLILSLPAGYLLLRSPWTRALLTAAAVPLGILRNGFRIFTIGELCVHIGPRMIDSYIHRTGGWMFFLLSLVPFFLLLLFLGRMDRPKAARIHRGVTEDAEEFKPLIHELHE